MNSIRLQRLPPEERETYIRNGLTLRSMSELRHMVSQYGIKGVISMPREELENIVVKALVVWASNGHTLPSYKDETMLPVPEYKPENGTCAIPLCKQTIFKRGICSKHYYEYEHTMTGTFSPAWLEYLKSDQMSMERKTYNSELPFSHLEDGGEYLVGG
jgi:hypothetical protein